MARDLTEEEAIEVMQKTIPSKDILGDLVVTPHQAMAFQDYWKLDQHWKPPGDYRCPTTHEIAIRAFLAGYLVAERKAAREKEAEDASGNLHK